MCSLSTVSSAPAFCTSGFVGSVRFVSETVTGMVLLHGMLCGGDGDDDDDDRMDYPNGDEDHEFDPATTWDAHVWANRNVTYYGMMVASYERVTN